MDNAFQWNALDVQHQQLFDIIRELNDAMLTGHGKDKALSAELA